MNEADEAFEAYIRAVMAHRQTGATCLERTLAQNPTHVPALALRGFSLRKLGRRDQFQAIDELLEKIAPGAPRERALFEALRAWRFDDGPRAVAILEEQLGREPRDVLLLKLVHGIRFMLGDSVGMRVSLERVIEALDPEGPLYPFVLGCLAFALEETGDYLEAERVGRRAVEREPEDVWGAHAVAHALLMQGRHHEGALWLRAYTPHLDGCTNLAGHVAWHEALFLLELGRTAEVLELFDLRVACHLQGDYRDVSNATSLLFRLERHGVDVGTRWERYATFAIERAGDHGSAFADLHYVLALSGAGRHAEAERFVASMMEATDRGFEAQVAHEVGVPLARAVLDLYAGRARDAGRILESIAPDAIRIGGSHAQRFLLNWILDAAQADAAVVGAQ